MVDKNFTFQYDHILKKGFLKINGVIKRLLSGRNVEEQKEAVQSPADMQRTGIEVLGSWRLHAGSGSMRGGSYGEEYRTSYFTGYQISRRLSYPVSRTSGSTAGGAVQSYTVVFGEEKTVYAAGYGLDLI